MHFGKVELRVSHCPGHTPGDVMFFSPEYRLALSGSANLDSRSLFLNYELMVAFYAVADIRRFASFIEEHREIAARYLPRNPGLLRDFAEGPVLWLAFQL